MDQINKLKKLLLYWKEHNDEHAKSYKIWAEKASVFGNIELAGILEKLYGETKKLNNLLDEALERV